VADSDYLTKGDLANDDNCHNFDYRMSGTGYPDSASSSLDSVHTRSALAASSAWSATPRRTPGVNAPPPGSRDLLRAAIDRMLRAAAEAGTLRADVPADDVMMAVGGVTLIAGHEHRRELASRLLDLVMAGLRPL
jgi:hypothetical protein